MDLLLLLLAAFVVLFTGLIYLEGSLEFLRTTPRWVLVGFAVVGGVWWRVGFIAALMVFGLWIVADVVLRERALRSKR